MALKENYKDDILDVSQNVKRKYRMTENQDGTVSFDDETEYLQEGDNFGSGAINPIAHAINGLNNYNFHPSGSIDLVAYIADDTYYLNNDSKYVLADSTTGQALITSDPTTYKALASNTDLYGIEGADTVSGFEPTMTPVTIGGHILRTIDDKLNYLCGINDTRTLVTRLTGTRTGMVDKGSDNSGWHFYCSVQTVDLSNIPNYQNLSINKFVFDIVQFYNDTNNYGNGPRSYKTLDIEKSYDPSTGILTVGNLFIQNGGSASSPGDRYSLSILTVDIYLV